MSNVENTPSPAQAEVNRLVEKGLVALEQFRQLNQDQVNYIVAKASVAALHQKIVSNGSKNHPWKAHPL